MPFSPRPLDLPAPQPVRFGKSPLALVACQVRFEHLGAPDEAGLRVLRDLFADDYPLVQQMQGLQIQFGVPGPQASAQQGWRFVSLEQDWTVSVLANSASIETTAYRDWEDLERRLRHVIAAVHEVLVPRVEVRLGLRYVNHFSRDDVTEPMGWAKYLRPELVALTAADPIALSAFNAQQVIQLDAGDAVLTVRHGVPGGPIRHGVSDGLVRLGALGRPVRLGAPGGLVGLAPPAGLGELPANPFYLLDMDCAREGQRALDIEELLAEADRFNTLITSLFQWCINESLWKELDPHDK